MVQKAVGRSGVSSSQLSCEAQQRIAQQRMIVASFEPGSAAHRMATEVLLLLLDSAHVMAEAHGTLTAARLASALR